MKLNNSAISRSNQAALGKSSAIDLTFENLGKDLRFSEKMKIRLYVIKLWK